MNGGWGISYEIALRWMPLDLTDDKSTLVQVMAWCRQATSHYLSQCWPRSMSPNGITRPQRVKVTTPFHSRVPRIYGTANFGTQSLTLQWLPFFIPSIFRLEPIIIMTLLWNIGHRASAVAADSLVLNTRASAATMLITSPPFSTLYFE